MSPPNSAAADRNLLFGILALQLEFLGRDTLIAALHAWVLDKSKSLGQILANQGQLTAERRQLLEALVDEHVKAHQDNPQQSLAALSSASSLRQDLQQIADDDVQASLAHVAVGAESQTAGTASYHSTGAATPGLRYRVLRPHAKGGLGEVFVAEDTELHREVALKEIRQDHVADRDSRGRFVLEAEITGGLEHPGIVPVYGLGQYDDGRPFYAMRFIKGDNLKEAIQRFHQAETAQRDPTERNIAFRDLLGRFVDVCNAVAYAHSRGILHRDLKPGNVMLGKYGETLVVDWGLAKAVGRAETMPDTGEPTLRPSSADSGLAATRMGTAVGTAAFMSPEQAAGRLDLLGPASDVYSLGATLYAVLTGKAPFRGESGDILRQVQRGAFTPPRQVTASAPAALEAVCLKAMALRPQQRYHSALQLAEDMEHWLADEPVSAWSEPVTVRVGRWARQHKPLVSGAVAALLVGLLALGAAGYWYSQEQARRTLEGARTADKVQQAVAQAREARQKLQEQLRQPGGVFALLNHPADWQGQLQAAQASWKQAHSLAQNAEELLDEPLRQDLRELQQRLKADTQDYRLALDLEKVRLDKATLVEGQFNDAGAVQAYGKVFGKAGFAVAEGDGPALAEKIRRSPVREQLVAALEDWALSAWALRSAWGIDQKAPAGQLLALARLADPDPARNQLRNDKLWRNPPALAQLAAGLKHRPGTGNRAGPPLSPQLYFLMGALLFRHGTEGEAWLREGQAAYPADFWLNLHLGNLLATEKKSAEEAVGFFRAVLAVRPYNSAAHNNLGATLYAKGDTEGAIQECRRAIALDPKYAYPHTNLGLALEAQGNLAGAIQAYRRAIALDPKLAPAHFNLGGALKTKGNLAEAIQAYRQAIALDPKYAPAHYNLGHALKDKGDLAEAIQAYRQAIALDPKHAKAQSSLGAALAAKGDTEGAIQECRRAIALDPKDAVAHNNLGNALKAQGDLAGAIQAYRQAIALDPKYAPAHNNLGIALQAKGDLAEAIQECRRAIALDPKFGKAHGALGNALMAQGDLAGAIQEFRQAIALDPKLAAHNNLGNALMAQGDLAGAIQEFRQAIDLDPKDAPAHFNLGNALKAQGDLAGAIQAYRQAIALDPKYAPAHNNLGIALQAKGDLAEAIQEYRRAIALDPKDARVHDALGLALEAQGNLAGAIQEYRQAIALDPKLAPAHSNLGGALAAKGDLAEAIQEYRRAIALDPKLAQAHGALGQALLAQGEFAAAQQATQRCLQLLPPGHPLRGFVQKQLQQCQQALQREQRVHALLQGQVPPTRPAEALQLAQFCRRFQHYPAAARLYAAALAAQPELAENLALGYRYQAATAAALAAAGQGKDADKLAANDKAKLRQQALDWLRADLKRLTQTVADYQAASKETKQPAASPLEKLTGQASQPGPADLLRVCDRLQRWQTDPDLASLRADKELAKLPAAEPADWRQFWVEVRTLEKQARACFSEQRHEGKLTAQRKVQVQEVKLQAGKTYAFDLESTAFNAFLRLEDNQGKKLDENDDVEPGVILNSRLLFTPQKDGTYRLVATAFQGRGTGAYVLRMREFAAPRGQQSKEKAPGTQK